MFQILIATITYLLPTTESSPHELDKRVGSLDRPACTHQLHYIQLYCHCEQNEYRGSYAASM